MSKIAKNGVLQSVDTAMKKVSIWDAMPSFRESLPDFPLIEFNQIREIVTCEVRLREEDDPTVVLGRCFNVMQCAVEIELE